MTLISLPSLNRVNNDKDWDKLPFASTVNNLIAIFEKILDNQISSEKTHYYRYLADKSYGRCLTLTLPILGQIAVYVFDWIQKRRINACMDRFSKFREQGNQEGAFESLKKAAELGSSDALDNLARYYELGIGVEKNLEQAYELYQKAADNGNFEGILNVISWPENNAYEKEKLNDLRELVERFPVHFSDPYFAIQYIFMGLIPRDLNLPATPQNIRDSQKITRFYRIIEGSALLGNSIKDSHSPVKHSIHELYIYAQRVLNQ